MKKLNLNGLAKVIQLGLAVKRELRASRNEKRAEAREERAQEKHEMQKKKTYFGREI